MKKTFILLFLTSFSFTHLSAQKQKKSHDSFGNVYYGWQREIILDVTEYANKMFPKHNYEVWDKEYTEFLPHYYTKLDTVPPENYYRPYYFKDQAGNVLWKIQEGKDLIILSHSTYDKNSKETSYFSAGWIIKPSGCDTCWIAIIPKKQVKKHKTLFKEAAQLFVKK